MSIGVRIVGADEIHSLLAKYQGTEAKKRLQKAAQAGAKVLKPKVKAAVPPGHSRLKRSISAKRAKRQLPAAIVVARPKIAFYRHFTIAGTRRGVRANPFIARTADAHGDAAIKAAEAELFKELSD
jgi:hypothetical protein